MTRDFEALRDQFPNLRDRTYLVTHSFGPVPQAAFEDLDAYRETLLRRPRHLEPWLERIEETYQLVGQLLRTDPAQLALRESASASHATILAALPRADDRDRILVAATHFPSIRYMAQAQRARGFDVITVKPATGTHVTADDLCRALDRRVAAMLMPGVSSFDGARIDVARVCEQAHAAGAIPVVDAYSGLGIVPYHLDEMSPCVLIGGTMKWLCGGGTGLAFLAVHPSLVERLPPAHPAWLGHADFLEFSPQWAAAAGARRYQVGTPAVEPIYTARAGLRFVLEHGVERLRARNLAQLRRLSERARAVGLDVLSPDDDEARAGCLSISVQDPGRIVAHLRAEGVDVDTRGPNAIRVGPHACVRDDECDAAIDRIADAAVTGGTKSAVTSIEGP